MRRRCATRAEQYERPSFRVLQERVASNTLSIRERWGWSQEEAAHRFSMATQVFQRVEAGTVNLTLTTVARVCDGLDVDPVALFAPAPAPLRRGRGRPPAKSEV